MSDIDRILERINSRLSEVGMSASAASKKAGRPDAIRNLQRAVKLNAQNKDSNREGISTATIFALAKVLNTSPEWLLNGSDRTVINAADHNILRAVTKAAHHVLEDTSYSDTEARTICRAILEAGA